MTVTVSQFNWNLECWFLGREENQRTWRKTLGVTRRTNNMPDSGIKPRP